MFFGLLVVAIVSLILKIDVYATNNYNNDDVTSSISSYSVDTRYEAGTYVEPIEVYNVDLEWEDLHWIFIYSDDISNPTSSVWITKAYYDSHISGSTNDYNHAILNNINSFRGHETVGIDITNKSEFAVNISGSIEQKSNANYTNPAGLKITNADNISWQNEALISGLIKNASGSFSIKPTATRFVNNTGTTTNVTGEVKLVFTKSS